MPQWLSGEYSNIMQVSACPAEAENGFASRPNSFPRPGI